MLTDAQRRVRLILEARLNNTEIAKLTSCSRNTVAGWRRRVAAVDLTLDKLDDLDELEVRQLVTPGSFARKQSFAAPDVDHILSENADRGVKLKTLYQEYTDGLSPGERPMGRSTFYRLLEEHRGRNDVILSFEYEPGEMIQADFVGRKKKKQPLLIDQDGEEIDYDLFCAASAKSRKIFVIAIESQAKLPTLQAFVAMLTFFGGVPVIVTIDNFAAAVATPRRGNTDAVITPEFQELADHYGFGLKAARVRKPRDKGIVENAVGIVQNDVLAPLRDRRFFSLAEMNHAIRERLTVLNARPMAGHNNRSRDELFNETDAPGYRPLPSRAFEPGQWLLRLRVGQNYRVHVLGNRYSVPSRLAGQIVKAKITTTSVHLSHLGKLIVTHPRATGKDQDVVQMDHVPPAHRAARLTTLGGIKALVRDIGPNAELFIDGHFRINKKPSSTAQAAQKLYSLSEQFSCERLDRACQRANFIEKQTVQTVENILGAGLDNLPVDSSEDHATPAPQSNIRGAAYFADLMNARDEGDEDV